MPHRPGTAAANSSGTDLQRNAAGSSLMRHSRRVHGKCRADDQILFYPRGNIRTQKKKIGEKLQFGKTHTTTQKSDSSNSGRNFRNTLMRSPTFRLALHSRTVYLPKTGTPIVSQANQNEQREKGREGKGSKERKKIANLTTEPSCSTISTRSSSTSTSSATPSTNIIR